MLTQSQVEQSTALSFRIRAKEHFNALPPLHIESTAQTRVESTEIFAELQKHIWREIGSEQIPKSTIAALGKKPESGQTEKHRQ